MKYFPLILILFLSFPCNVAAENEEITYLLSFIAESGCTFIRNGGEHHAEDASKHLAMKFNRVKKRIKTAEDFIDKIASKSSMSGKKYEVRCDNRKFNTGSWLKDALAAYRISKKH
jgi:hypothetical protein